MGPYKIHTLESAPEKSRPALQGLKQNFGLIPNLAATMAESPALVNGFAGAFLNFHTGTSFSGAERQALLLTNAVTNRCAWAVAFHSTMALKEGVAPHEVEAIRSGRLPGENRLAALSLLTRTLIEKRGRLAEADQDRFFSAGFGQAELFDVLAGLAVSTLANYAGNVADPELEGPFQAQKWEGH